MYEKVLLMVAKQATTPGLPLFREQARPRQTHGLTSRGGNRGLVGNTNAMYFDRSVCRHDVIPEHPL